MRKTIELSNSWLTNKQRGALLKRVFGKDEKDTRAAGLAEAAALLPTITVDAFSRNDASEEFLNGMAYGAASYCSAIRALCEKSAPAASAMGAAPASASSTNEERLQELEQGAHTAQADGWREVCAVLEEVQPGWGRRPGTGIDVAVATIRELATQALINKYHGARERTLRDIIAAAYQMAGAHDAPANILDVLANPDDATPAQVDAMLAYAQTVWAARAAQVAPNAAADVAQAKELWQAALADAAMYVEAHCVDGARHARHIMEQPLPQIRAVGATAESGAADTLGALLWLYRRLPRGYGRQDHIERPIVNLGAQTGTDVAGDLADRARLAAVGGKPGRDATIGKPMRAIDTDTVQPFAIVHGYEMGSDRSSLACFNGSGYEFADGDIYQREGDSLAGFPAEFLTLFQLEQRLWAAGAAPGPAGAAEKPQVLVPLTEVIVEAAHAARATGRIALTYVDQAGLDRPTDIAKSFVRHLVSIHRALQQAVEQNPPTGVSVAELAQLRRDLERSACWGTASAAEVCRRAGDVIERLLGGLSASQLAPVGKGSEENAGVAR